MDEEEEEIGQQKMNRGNNNNVDHDYGFARNSKMSSIGL